MGKNGAEISGFLVVEKPPSTWKKVLSKKKYVQLICANKMFKAVCGKFFKINSSPDI